MAKLSATRRNCIAILWVSPVRFTAITLSVAPQRMFIVVYFVLTQSGNFWINPRIPAASLTGKLTDQPQAYSV